MTDNKRIFIAFYDGKNYAEVMNQLYLEKLPYDPDDIFEGHFVAEDGGGEIYMVPGNYYASNGEFACRIGDGDSVEYIHQIVNKMAEDGHIPFAQLEDAYIDEFGYPAQIPNRYQGRMVRGRSCGPFRDTLPVKKENRG